MLVLLQHYVDLLLHAEEGAFQIELVHRVEILNRCHMEWLEGTRHASIVDSSIEPTMLFENVFVESND